MHLRAARPPAAARRARSEISTCPSDSALTSPSSPHCSPPSASTLARHATMPPLQPKDNSEYATKQFWEDRYAGADTEQEDMDWTLKYDKLKQQFDALVVPVVGPKDRQGGGVRT